jgi:hypothetical protein
MESAICLQTSEAQPTTKQREETIVEDSVATVTATVVHVVETMKAVTSHATAVQQNNFHHYLRIDLEDERHATAEENEIPEDAQDADEGQCQSWQSNCLWFLCHQIRRVVLDYQPPN